jgi:hypothetical protein
VLASQFSTVLGRRALARFSDGSPAFFKEPWKRLLRGLVLETDVSQIIKVKQI